MKDEIKIAVSQNMTIADLDEKTTDLHRAFNIMIADVNDQELLLKMKQKVNRSIILFLYKVICRILS